METITQSRHETEWITISLDEYESMKTTIETLSSREAMAKILCGEKELAAGKGRRTEVVGPSDTLLRLSVRFCRSRRLFGWKNEVKCRH